LGGVVSRRVVITGMGAVSPLGANVETLWSGLVAGKSGITAIDHLQYSDLSVQCYGQAVAGDVNEVMSPRDVRRTDGFIHFGMLAAAEAMTQASLDITEENACRMGVAVGSGIGGLGTIETNVNKVQAEKRIKKISPFFIPGTLVNMLAGNISIKHNLRGPNISLVSACATGTHNIGMAARLIAYGDADVMLAGASENASCSLGIGGFAALRGLSTHSGNPTEASRPWDKNRDGFILSDGAAIVVLEELEHALNRGANILAEVKGFAMNADAHHITQPGGGGAVKCMQNACEDAKISTKNIDHINPHATSTPVGDEKEAMAINTVLGEHASNVTVSATKSMTGHLLGAAGALETIISALIIREQTVPATINCKDPEDYINFNLIRDKTIKQNVNTILNLSLGFGGTNACLILSKHNA
jgi:3-oxoacyl-[acyl-carrier-protein] synthase II